MQHRTAERQRKGRSTLESLREMKEQSEMMLDTMALEIGTKEVVRQNMQALANAIELIEEAYTLPLARAH